MKQHWSHTFLCDIIIWAIFFRSLNFTPKFALLLVSHLQCGIEVPSCGKYFFPAWTSPQDKCICIYNLKFRNIFWDPSSTRALIYHLNSRRCLPKTLVIIGERSPEVQSRRLHNEENVVFSVTINTQPSIRFSDFANKK